MIPRISICLVIIAVLCAQENIDVSAYKIKADRAFADAKGDPQLLSVAAGYYMDAREYKIAEDIYTHILEKYNPHNPYVYSNLSVFCGKQKKYDLAIRYADLALDIDPHHMHAKAVKASWLYEKGEKERGLQLFESIPMPQEADQLDLYYGCRACFYASVGDADRVKESVKLIKSDGFATFFKNDIVFDKFRNESWYLDMVKELPIGNSQ